MRLYFAFLLATLALAGCSKAPGPQRLDFVNTTRYTSSNRVGLSPADTLATRVFAENTDANGANLGRLVVTVQYQPRRNPFVYPTPLSSFSRDSIDKSSESFVYLDTILVDRKGQQLSNFTFTNIFGVRTTTGAERWQYDLRNSKGDPTASRAVRLGMRRPDSLATYQDYTLRLIIPAIGVGANDTVRIKSSRRFLHLRAGLALPAYTVLRAGAADSTTAQGRAQRLTDLIILRDGLTLVSPSAASLTLNAMRWPSANRRKTLIYPTGLTPTTFANSDSTAIKNTFAAASGTATTGQGQFVGPVAAEQVYVFRTDEATATRRTPYRYGLLLVVSVPTSTTTNATAGLQLQVRMAK
jgi:hypothetical protein